MKEMRRHLIILLSFVLILSILTGCSNDEAEIGEKTVALNITVTSEETGEAVEGAVINLQKQSAVDSTVYTDQDGKATLTIRGNTQYTLDIISDNYYNIYGYPVNTEKEIELILKLVEIDTEENSFDVDPSEEDTLKDIGTDQTSINIEDDGVRNELNNNSVQQIQINQAGESEIEKANSMLEDGEQPFGSYVTFSFLKDNNVQSVQSHSLEAAVSGEFSGFIEAIMDIDSLSLDLENTSLENYHMIVIINNSQGTGRFRQPFLRLDGNYLYASIPLIFKGELADSIILFLTYKPDREKEEEARIIKSVAMFKNIQVSYGTKITDIPLPTEVLVTTEKEYQVEIPIIWDKENTSPPYNPEQPDNYYFSGELDLSGLDNLNNPDDKNASVIITVRQPSNRAPVFNEIGNKSVKENEQLSFTISAEDADGDDLIYRATGELSTYFDRENRTFTWTPSYDDSGSYDLIFRVSDGELTDNETMTVNVVNVDRPPVLDEIGDKQIEENNSLAFNVTASDPDGDPVVLSAGTLPEGASFNPENGEFSWTPGYEQSGSYDITFTAGANGMTVSKTITVVVGNGDRPPLLAEIGDKEIDENSGLSFTVTASDPDGDSVTLSSSTLPEGASFNPESGEFNWTPDYDQSGSYNITFTAEANGLRDSEMIKITVNNVNQEPEITDQAVTVKEDTAVKIDLLANASDPDGDSLAISEIGSVGNGELVNNNDGTVTYTPNPNYNGNDSFTYTVNDGKGGTASCTVPITIKAVNDAPVLETIGNKSINENQTLTFSISCSDVDGDPLTYTAAGDLSGYFDPASKTFSWHPGFFDSGSYEMTFEVSDGELTDSETITILVGNVDRPPRLSYIGDKEIDEQTLLNFTVTGSDPDGNPVTLSASNLPDGASFNTDTGEFNWTPAYNQPGVYNVTFTVVAGGRSDSEEVTITVNDTAPIFKSVTSNNAAYKDGDTLTITADIGQPALTVRADFSNIDDSYTTGDENVTDNGDNTYTITYTIDENNNIADNTGLTILITAEDAGGKSTTDSSLSLKLDNTLPTFSTVTIASDNNNDSSLAKIDDTITLTIESNEDILTPSVTIAGNNATVTDSGDTDDSTWKAAYTMQAGDVGGSVTFTLEADDLAGNSATQVTSTTDGSSVTFDDTAPNQPTGIAGVSTGLDDDVLDASEVQNEQIFRVNLDLDGDTPVAGDMVTLYKDGTILDTSANITNGYVDFTIPADTFTGDGIDINFTATVTDRAGNESNASPVYTVTVDSILPTIVSAKSYDTDDDGLTDSIQFEFSEPVMDNTFYNSVSSFTFTDDDENYEPGTSFSTSLGLAGDMFANDEYVVISIENSHVDTTGEIKYKFSAGPGIGTDRYGNSLAAISDAVSAIDKAAPIIEEVLTTDSDKDGKIEYTITFSEAIDDATLTESDFNIAADVSEDLTGTGTANDNVYVIESTSVDTGTMTVSYSQGTLADLSGNLLADGASLADGTDEVAPIYTVSAVSNHAFGDEISLEFSETMDESTLTAELVNIMSISGSNSGQFNLNNASSAWDETGEVFTITLNEEINGDFIQAGETVTVTLADSSVADPAGNNITGTEYTVESSVPVEKETTAPTYTVSYSSTPVKENDEVTITVEFSEAMSESVTPEIALSGSADNLTAKEMVRTDADTYTYVWTVGSGDGEMTPEVTAGTDLVGNLVTNTGSTRNTIVIDNTAPTYTVSYSSAPVKENDVVTITAEFSEAMSESVTPKIALSGSADNLAVTEMVRTDADTYTYDWTVGSGDGEMTPEVTVGTDLAGNVVTNTGSTRNTVTVDNTAPTYTVSYSSAPVKENDVVTITAEFCEAMSDSMVPEIALSGSADNLAVTDMVKTDADTYTYDWTVGSGDGEMTPEVTVGTDLAGNVVTNTGSTRNTVTVDNTAPTYTVSYSSAPVKENDVVTITAEFSEAMSESVTPKIALSGSADNLAVTDMVRTDADTYTYDWTVGAGVGEMTPEVTAATDPAGNTVTNTGSTRTTIVVDNTVPATPTAVAGQSAGFADDTLNISEAAGSQIVTVSLDGAGTTTVVDDIVAISSDGGIGEISTTTLTAEDISNENASVTVPADTFTVDGDYNIKASVRDKAGNSSGTSPAYSVAVDLTAPVLNSWNLDMALKTLEMNFNETVDVSTLNVDQITIQETTDGLGDSYTLTDSTTASADGTTIVIDLSDTDYNNLKDNWNLVTEKSNSYLSINGGMITDLAGNNVTVIASGSALQVNNFTILEMTGTAEHGETLTAHNGLPGVSYQWMRNGSNISGATAKNYTLTDADVGRHISVVVDNGTDTLTSSETEMVKKGGGTQANPYAVATPEQLQWIGTFSDAKYFQQVEDINLSGINWSPVSFNGVYDGNGYKIKELTVDGGYYAGLFSTLTTKSGDIGGTETEIRNVHIEGADINCTGISGTLVGKMKNYTYVKNCSATGINVYASGNTVGGLVGQQNNAADVLKSYAVGSVSGKYEVGGLTGCLSPSFNDPLIQNSYAIVDVTLRGLFDDSGGGLVGYSTDCGEYWPDTIIKNCYAAGSINNGGGLVGKKFDNRKGVDVINSYYDSQSSGQNDTGYGAPRTTNQMKTGTEDSTIDGASMYSGWDPAIWDFEDDTTYPMLK